MIRYLVLFAFLAGVVLSNPCKDVKTGRKLQDPTECRGYILCHRGRSYMRTCTFGTKFDEAEQKCVRGKCPPCNCPSVTAPPTSPPPTSPSTAPSTAPPTSPSPSTASPTSPSPSTAPPTSPSPSTVPPTSPSPSTAPPTSPSPSTTLPPTSPPNLEVHCESHLNGKQIADPKDCTKFWVCVYDTPVKKDCPAGLWFDEDLLVCNRPESAKCTAAAHYKQN